MSSGIIIALICLALFVGYIVGRQSKSPKVDLVKDFGNNVAMELDVKQLSELRQLLNNQQKIEAIKLYRQLTGAGLKESKEAIESLEREN